MKINRSFIRCL